MNSVWTILQFFPLRYCSAPLTGPLWKALVFMDHRHSLACGAVAYKATLSTSHLHCELHINTKSWLNTIKLKLAFKKLETVQRESPYDPARPIDAMDADALL